MKFDKKEAAGQPLPFSAPKNPQWVMLAALLLSYAAGYEYVDRCLGFGWRASTPPGAPECWCLWRCIP